MVDPRAAVVEQVERRSCGGLTSKIHALVDAEGCSITLHLTAGQVVDCTEAEELIDSLGEGAILWPTRVTTATPFVPRRPSGAPGPTSHRRSTVRAVSPSPMGAIDSAVSSNGSLAGSHSFVASQCATASGPKTPTPPSTSSRREAGASAYEPAA